MQTIAKIIQGPATPPENAINTPTICVFCTHNCSVRVDVKDNTIVAIRGDESNPNTAGYTCNKVQAIPNYVQHAQRLEHPLKRQPDGSFERISWDQAITEIAAKLNAIRKQHAPRSIAMFGLGGQGNHMDAFGGVPFMASLNSHVYFNALGQEKTQHALVWRHLYKATPELYLIGDDEHSDYVLVLGTNPVISNRGLNPTDVFKELATDKQRKLVVVDPRITETAKRADRHIRVRPGGDAYLLMGFIAVILRENLQDKSYIQGKVKGFEQLAAEFKDVDPLKMAEYAGVSHEDIVLTAREFATSPSACISWDLGVEQTLHSTVISYLMNVMLLITGNAGVEKGNLFVEQFGPRGFFQAKQAKALVSGMEAIPFILPVGMFSPNLVAEEITTKHPDHIRALIVDASNPLLSYADTKALKAAFAQLELMVVIEVAMTETAHMAHYVLPAPVGYEKWEYATFPHANGFTPQLRPPVVRGPQEALPEQEIYYRLARAMNLVPKAPAILHKLAKKARSPLGAPLYLAALGTLAALRGGGLFPIMGRMGTWLYETMGPTLPSPALGVMWALSHGYALTRRKALNNALPEARKLWNPFAAGELVFQKLLDHPEGVLVGRVPTSENFEQGSRHPDGKAHIYHAAWMADIRKLSQTAPSERDPAYPFILNGGLRTGWTANTIIRDPAWRKGKGPHCPIIFNAEDAAALGIVNGDMVKLETRRGAIEGPAKIDAFTARGHLQIPNGFGMKFPDPVTGELKQVGILVNELMDTQDRDPYTGCPNTKYIQCRVAPLMKEAA
ncbi:MAG: molybdopterin-dependent oxidoreductase [Aquabacterium sp.]|nr:molybdopterin-dependent oxidoreductase [Aquabacterium sp.]